MENKLTFEYPEELFKETENISEPGLYLDRIQFAIVEYWSLCKLSQINKDTEAVDAFKKGLSLLMNDIKKRKITRRTLTDKLIDEFDFDAYFMVQMIIKDCFFGFDISNNDISEKIAKLFSSQIKDFIDAISDDKIDEYLENTFIC